MWWDAPRPIPPVRELEKPAPLPKVLEKDAVDYDCLTCRLFGSVVMMGLGAYSYDTGHTQLKLQQKKILKSKSMFGMRSRRMGINGIAMTFVGLGLYRLVN